MYLLEFVNEVRRAQGSAPLDSLPDTGSEQVCPLEVAMRCRIESGLMYFTSPEQAAAVARGTGLVVGIDRLSVAMPAALSFYASFLTAARSASPAQPETAQHVLALV